MKNKKIVVVSAGLSQPSSTRLLADLLAASARRQFAETPDAVGGPELEIVNVELRDLAVEVTNAVLMGYQTQRLQEALEALGGADGVIAVTPVFNASYSGLFKSFFDLVDAKALTGMPVLLAATGGTTRHSLAIDHALRPLFSYLQALIVPTGVFAASADWGAIDEQDAPGGQRSDLSVRIDRAAGELAAMIGGSLPARTSDTLEDQIAAIRARG